MYKTVHDPLKPERVGAIWRETDGAFIPLDPANTDYQQYLAWLAEGNEPEPWNPDTINSGEE